MSKNYISIIDDEGNNYFGILADENAQTIFILDPVRLVTNVVDGSVSLIPIPLFFPEFLSKDNKYNAWYFNRNKAKFIASHEMQYNEEFIESYESGRKLK